MSKRALVLLARAPSARGKTRLTAHLDAPRARALRERLLLDTLSAARATGYAVTIAFIPDDAREELRLMTGAERLVVQRGDDLGERMRNAMADAFAGGAEDVVLIGSDLPTLPPAHVQRAFELLARGHGADGRAQVVLGATTDGGFYLLGAHREMPDIFGGIPWGGRDVLARVCRSAHAAGVNVSFAPDWWDVDTPEDLLRLPDRYGEFLA